MNRKNEFEPKGLPTDDMDADDPTPEASDGAGRPSDERSLREKARAAIRSGQLPSRRPDRTWGGVGNGCHCVICGVPVEQDEVEIELEYAGDDGCPGRDDFHVHVRCLAAWEHELEQVQPAPPASATGEPSEPQPEPMPRRGALPGPTKPGRMTGRGHGKKAGRGRG